MHDQPSEFRRGGLAAAGTSSVLWMAGAFIPNWAIAASPAKSLTIAVASDLRFVIDELLARFSQTYRATDGKAPVIQVVIGSSGSFYHQIQRAAPFQLFLSADEDLVLSLASKGYGAVGSVSANGAINTGAQYAVGELALVWHGSPIQEFADGQWRDSIRRTKRLAIANPEHAPYGKAAVKWLQQTGLSSASTAKTQWVMADNVAQALQFVVSKAAGMGLVSLSLALHAQKQKLAGIRVQALRHLPGNTDLPLLKQRMLLLKDSSPEARAFYDFLLSREARGIWAAHGFAQER